MAFKASQIPTKWGFYYRCGLTQLFLAYALYSLLKWYGIMGYLGLGSIAFISYLGGYHILSGLNVSYRVRRLNKPNEYTVNLPHLRKFIKKKPQRMYLGRGFTWDVTHSQLYHYLTNEIENNKILKKEGKIAGRHYVHNLSDHEEDIVMDLPRHTLIVGTTGVGKTRMLELLSVQRIEYGEIVVIIDPKGDRSLINAVYQSCVEAGRKDDFRFVSLAHPTRSCSINPIANYVGAGDIAGRITSIMDQGKGSDVFIAFCYDVIATVADVMLTIGIPITLKNIKQYCIVSMESLADKVDEFEAENKITANHAQVLRATMVDLQTKIEHNRDHFSKMTTSLIPVMKVLTAGNVGGILSPEYADLSWQQIIDKKLVVYFYLGSMIDNYASSTVGKLLVQDLVSFVGQIYSFKVKSKFVPIHVMVDEFFSVLFGGYVDMLNKSREAGVQMYLGMQTTADIESKGSTAMKNQIIGLLENIICLRTPEQEMADKISTDFGTVEIEKRMRTQGTSANPGDSKVIYTSSISERIDKKEVPLLVPDIIKGLPRGHAIVSSEGRAPYKIKFPLIDRKPEEVINYFEDNILGMGERPVIGDEFESVVDQWDDVPDEGRNHQY
ncbi:type IV secretory system conjugative DNA transfer family protein [Pseudodesulfovibrio pelocollis]|uniref:type IV secretory system conjugative DNA transfer family protein n=1 Tax=Pseudodesulfovibrio pelocollis TaxID=3051432 RepID=UPI00255A8B9F|nr:type IV secretory system conjugative DNA transfer family protein [Pseudodesulfovibrio sp. SB368]